MGLPEGQIIEQAYVILLKLDKNKEVLVSNDWGKIGKKTQRNFVGSKSLLNMTLFFRTTSSWVVSFTGLITIVLAKPSTSGVMLPIHRINVVICSRDVFRKSQPCPIHCHTLSFILPWPPPWIICHRSFSPPSQSLAPFCVTDVGFIKALLWQITSCRHQLIIQEVDLGTPPQYFEACMPQWQVSHFRRQVYINGLRPKDFAWCSMPSPLFTPREL